MKALVLMLLGLALAACTSPTPSPSATGTPTGTPAPTAATITPSSSLQGSGSPSPVAGGCGGTHVFAGPGPDAALGLVDNPWASATPAAVGIVAYFWNPPPDILFAQGPGAGTKILWISHASPPARLAITAHPLHGTAPVVHFAFPPADSDPSNIDLPNQGCWQLDLTLGTAHASLAVLVAPPLAACDPGQLDVPLAGWQGASGQMFGSFLLRNVGSSPCLATDPAAVGLQDAAGTSLAIRDVEEVSRTPQHPILLPHLPLPSDGAPPANGFGSIAFIWANWCGADPVRPVALVVNLGAGVRRVVPVPESGSIPRCDAPSAPSTLEVYPLDTLPGSPFLVTPSP